MLSLQNIHTISEEKKKEKKAPSKRKDFFLGEFQKNMLASVSQFMNYIFIQY